MQRDGDRRAHRLGHERGRARRARRRGLVRAKVHPLRRLREGLRGRVLERGAADEGVAARAALGGVGHGVEGDVRRGLLADEAAAEVGRLALAAALGLGVRVRVGEGLGGDGDGDRGGGAVGVAPAVGPMGGGRGVDGGEAEGGEIGELERLLLVAEGLVGLVGAGGGAWGGGARLIGAMGGWDRAIAQPRWAGGVVRV